MSGAILLAAVAAGLLLAPPVAAAAGPIPSADGPVVVDPPLTRPGAVYPAERLLFPQASADGAIVDTGDGQFRMAADVMFEFDRADLTPRAGDEIVRIAAELRAAQPQGLQAVEVIGHTDATGDEAYNQQLSEQRAGSVSTALAAALGPDVEVRASGRGEVEPIADNATTQGQALNRRVEVRIAETTAPSPPPATAGGGTDSARDPGLAENRPVLASAVLRDESGIIPHDVRVDLNTARVSGNVVQLMFTARSLNPPEPVFGDGSWTVADLFGDRVSGGQDAADSVDGVYLLDPVNGTRLLPGRNPDGTCLCSGGLAGVVVAPGVDVVLMADFAAPPGAVAAVDVAVPGAGVFAGIPLTR
jgi:outer membrane protein OmpA-like peptidoglycan-associated protein